MSDSKQPESKGFLKDSKAVSKVLGLLTGMANKMGYGKKKRAAPKKKGAGRKRRVGRPRGKGLFGAVGGGLDGMARGLFGGGKVLV